jgi:rhodanese-related sulfurtransferase
MSNAEPVAISPREAWEMLETHSQAVFVDIRSSMEFLFVGHPKGAMHIPWIDEPDWVVNPHFTTEIRKLLLGGVGSEAGESPAPVILICRSGKRSLEAGKTLLRDGMQLVYHIAEGFEGNLDEHHHRGTLGGWRFRGLPWEQC